LWRRGEGNYEISTLDRGSHFARIPPGQVTVWAIDEQERNTAFSTKRGPHLRVRFTPNGELSEVAMMIDDSTWGITAIAFSPDGKTLASGDGDGKSKFWQVPDVR
jgi:WD40 repeat protein